MVGYARTVFSLELRKIMSYRADFWVHFLGNVLTQVALAFFLWKSIFEFMGVDELGGYDFSTLMLYYIMVPLVDRMVRGPEMNHIALEIYEGTLNRYLIYPVSFFGYKYTTHIAQSSIFSFQFIMAVIVYLLWFGVPEGVNLHWKGMLMGGGAVLTGTVLFFFLVASLEMVAFWADHVWSLLVMLRFILYFTGGGMIPLSLFPELLQKIVFYLPFPYLASFPIRCFIGRVTIDEYLLSIGIMAAWIVITAIIAAFVWRAGLKRYSGIGI